MSDAGGRGRAQEDPRGMASFELGFGGNLLSKEGFGNIRDFRITEDQDIY